MPTAAQRVGWHCPTTTRYAWRHLAYHLAQAGRAADLRTLLTNQEAVPLMLTYAEQRSVTIPTEHFNFEAAKAAVMAATTL